MLGEERKILVYSLVNLHLLDVVIATEVVQKYDN